MSETVDLCVIARLESEAAVADLFACEVFYDTDDGSEAGRTIEGWWESIETEAGTPVSLDTLGEVLTANGYTRTSDWRERVTSSGAVRYFADAVTRLEELDP